jgi:hypothetical protein
MRKRLLHFPFHQQKQGDKKGSDSRLVYVFLDEERYRRREKQVKLLF